MTEFEVIDDIANKIQMAYVLYKNNFKTTDYADYNIFRVEKTGKKHQKKCHFSNKTVALLQNSKPFFASLFI